MKSKLSFLVFLLIALGMQTVSSSHPGACNAPNPGWVGDGWCDDPPYNTEECRWDGGDCCGTDVKTDYCKACECLECDGCLDDRICYEVGTGFTSNCFYNNCQRAGSEYKWVSSVNRDVCCTHQGAAYPVGATMSETEDVCHGKNVLKCVEDSQGNPQKSVEAYQTCCNHEGTILKIGETIGLSDTCTFISCHLDNSNLAVSIKKTQDCCKCCVDADGILWPSGSELGNEKPKIVCCEGRWIEEPDCTITTEHPTTTTMTCPLGWTSIGTSSISCYKVTSAVMQWSQAKQVCLSAGGFLAEIESQEEQLGIASAFTQETRFMWIGLSDLAKENHFVWESTQQVPVYTDWSPGQPDNGSGTEDCAHLFGQPDKKWNDDQCWNKHAALCERHM